MKSKGKNILIFLMILVLIFLSFKIPYILLELEDKKMAESIYKREKNNSKIEVQAEKIYLVKAIHDMNNGYYDVQIGNATRVTQNTTLVESRENTEKNSVIESIENEILKMEDYKIIQKLPINENGTMNSWEIIEKRYKKSGTEYMMNCNLMQNEKYEINIETESKTGKILYIALPKEWLGENFSKIEIMQNYVKYLDLYIIDDWKIEDGTLKSEKAQLVITILENKKEEEILLFIRPSSNNIKIEYSTAAE